MKARARIDVKEDNISVSKNTEGVIKGCCVIEDKGYFYLVDFPGIKYPILVKQDDIIVADANKSTTSDVVQSDSKQIDKTEKEFTERKKAERIKNKKKKS